ncbi:MULTISPECIES: EthD family reductase [unclassified Desulfovibrio]|uniref:EthD family reductase n=1 Tax=unclassified Desulfovibrio TaxID=2593640 RepID=UPI0013EBE7A9|nr:MULTISPECIES: EthD family reductase [unclassified Desulfovibrio]
MVFKVIISYDGTAKDRFDRDYYCNNHIPHVRKVWEPFGLLDIRPFFPGVESGATGTVCISQCVFRDKAAMEAAFAAPGTKALLDDIPNFTDLPMQAGIVSPMEG